MRPDPARPAQKRAHQSRRLVALLAFSLVLAGGVTAVWQVRHPAPDPFTYLHGTLTRPERGAQPVLFRMNGQKGTQSFTMAQLAALPAIRYRATQPQIKQSVVYTGVSLRDLSQFAGLEGKPLRVVADDNFGATISPDDYQKWPVMIAYLADGQPMTVAQKGPLQVVFPNEQYPELANTRGSQWVWFTTGLAVAP